MMYNGQVSCSVVVKRDGEPLADPVVKTEGLLGQRGRHAIVECRIGLGIVWTA